MIAAVSEMIRTLAAVNDCIRCAAHSARRQAVIGPDVALRAGALRDHAAQVSDSRDAAPPRARRAPAAGERFC